ncbi:MipA/OmpV family protein [Shewanella litorisediminis]|uniref:MipA/OmpV family protein n=1 Tax=Shewanella litorisediminis TaxID=1173586 RepID=A0ABX7G556_9GAMM|nr:MipA/OmpV family protein [Shewanella litorisediminis]MCL2917965.1 MipA/OmpV family protein [Shewanella litorisediminis]QRH02398.1 MipA/OmpV family protein [Shewanella litorisediminis]
MKPLILFMLMLSLAFPLKAEELQTVTPGDWQVSLALGYGILENPRKKTEDITTYVLPSWYYYGEDFYVENFTLGYSLYETDWLSVDVQGQLNDDGIYFEYDGFGKLLLSDILGYKPNNGPIVRPGVEPPKLEPVERKLSYLGGLSATWYTPVFDLTTGVFYDVTGVHNGYEWQLSARKSFAWSWGAAGIEIGGVYKNADLVDYYYNVTQAESGARRPPAPLEAATNWHVKGVLNIPLSDSLNFVLTVNHTRLGKAIRESALIERDDLFSGFAGVSYSF